MRITLRNPLTAAVAQNVELAATTKIRDVVALAERALMANRDNTDGRTGGHALFARHGRMMLRGDLTIGDYDLPDGAELYLVPEDRATNERPEATSHKARALAQAQAPAQTSTPPTAHQTKPELLSKFVADE